MIFLARRGKAWYNYRCRKRRAAGITAAWRGASGGIGVLNIGKRIVMDTFEARKLHYEKAAKTVIANLKKRHMEGYYAADSGEALKIALSLIPEGSSVAWGGTQTCNDIGLIEAVKKGPYEAIDRLDARESREKFKEIYGKICTCDYFLMSTNAITLDGELVNIDRTGNRVSFLCFGPENIIIVAGMNKLVESLDEAISRAKNTAAPINAERLDRKTPCTAAGKCGDCCSPDCICYNTVITRQSDNGRVKVILVGEELGF